MTSHMVSSLLIAHGIEKVWIPSGWVQGVREPGGLSLLASSLVMFFSWQSADLMGSEKWVDNDSELSSIRGAGIQGFSKLMARSGSLGAHGVCHRRWRP